jgi:hypothetical protein
LRAGYLTALAARTLGVTPMLRPAIPSRFEPEGPQAGLPEVVEVHETEPILPGAPRSTPSRADDQPADTATRVDRPRRGFFESGFPRERAAMVGTHDSEAPDISELTEEPAEAARRQPAAPLGSRTTDLEPFADAAAASPGSVPRPGQAASSMARQEDESPGRADPAAEAARPLAALGSRAVWHVDVIQAGRSRQQVQASDGVSQLAGTSSTEPAIIVRIGRVDVRAVQAASPPTPAPRARPPAGPSLEEYLLARDRRRR